MPTNDRRNLRRTPWTVWASLAVCALLGITFLTLSSPKPVKSFTGLREAMSDLPHDIGIALCVSALVAGLFELYRHMRYEISTMRDVIDFVMDEKITSEVWTDLNYLIEDKVVIRRKLALRLEIKKNPDLKDGFVELNMEQDYELHPLRDRAAEYLITHELDYQFSEPDLHLPRWEGVNVTPTAIKKERRGDSEATKTVENPSSKIKIRVGLQPRHHSECINVTTSRVELITLPGSYNLYTPEFTKGVHIHLVNCPAEIEPQVLIRPRGTGSELIRQRDCGPIESWQQARLQPQTICWSFDELLFPGQGIEFKFIQRKKRQDAADSKTTTLEATAESTSPEEAESQTRELVI